MAELKRIQKPGGVSSHSIDLKDHLGGALNSLRFTEQRWEGPLFSRSGFCTNRIRFPEMMHLFEQAGFAVELLATQRWPALPIDRRRLDPWFQALADDDLCVQDFDVLLR